MVWMGQCIVEMSGVSAAVRSARTEAKMANKLQAMGMLAARSPSGLENAYAAEVASKKSSVRKTNNFVKKLALCVSALTPNALNAVRKMSTVVQPWYSENGRCTQTGKATAVSGSMCCGGRRHVRLSLRFSLAWCFLTM